MAVAMRRWLAYLAAKNGHREKFSGEKVMASRKTLLLRSLSHRVNEYGQQFNEIDSIILKGIAERCIRVHVLSWNADGILYEKRTGISRMILFAGVQTRRCSILIVHKVFPPPCVR